MLSGKGNRELAYTVRVDAIRPIVGKDRVECAVVGGWTLMVPRGSFKAGDMGVYFEIDSCLPQKPEFAFLASKKYRIKTQRYKTPDGPFYSQGLLMPFSDFPAGTFDNIDISQEHVFLTSALGVTYADAEDNIRKANTVDKYLRMQQRMGKKFAKQPYRWLLKRNWGKNLLYLFYGHKSNNKKQWPSHIAAKTDVERIQNMVWVLQDKQPYVATEKVDGSSCSIMAERGHFGKIKQYVCSRNVIFDAPTQKSYYDINIYFEAYEKYGLKEKIVQIMNELNVPNIAIQMEVFGSGIQKREYSMKPDEHQARVFHIVTSGVKMPMDKVVEICEKYDLPHVPIIDDNYILPDTIEELQAFVESEGSKIDGLPKEGIVFYDKATGQRYFKFVSPAFLDKYHRG